MVDSDVKEKYEGSPLEAEVELFGAEDKYVEEEIPTPQELDVKMRISISGEASFSMNDEVSDILKDYHNTAEGALPQGYSSSEIVITTESYKPVEEESRHYDEGPDEAEPVETAPASEGATEGGHEESGH